MSPNTAETCSTSDDELKISLSPQPPLKLGAYFEQVIFETEKLSDLVDLLIKICSYVNFVLYLDSFRIFYYFLQSFKANMKDTLYTCDFVDDNKLVSSIDQTLFTLDFCKQNLYEY